MTMRSNDKVDKVSILKLKQSKSIQACLWNIHQVPGTTSGEICLVETQAKTADKNSSTM